MNIFEIIKAALARAVPKAPYTPPKPTTTKAPAIDWDDEYKRMNYYADADFKRYQAAMASRVRDAEGLLPYIDFAAFQTVCPTAAQWATMTPEQKNVSGAVRF